jgi:hypothetical protein
VVGEEADMDNFTDNLLVIRGCRELKKVSVGMELGSYLDRFADFFSELNFKPFALKESAKKRRYMDR